MNGRSNSLAVSLAVIILIALGLGVVLFFQDAYAFLLNLDQDMKAILVVTLISSVFIGLSIRRAGRVYGVRRFQLDKKAQCYERFLRAWFNNLSQDSKNSVLEKAKPDEIDAATEQLMLWANADVIKQLATLRNGDVSSPSQNPATQTDLDSLIRAMRTDLGQNNLTLSAGDLSIPRFTKRE